MKKYYIKLDILRLFACLAILLYHLGILKGGFLAVNVFFLLSGYLTTLMAFKKDFNLKEYYINKFKKLYLPLIIIVFLTIAIFSNISFLGWFNIKPEVTSVLLGYNNFWQISANVDYFARHINSPFIHLWYISILLELDLIFPLLFILLEKIKTKISKVVPVIILFILGFSSLSYFCYSYFNNQLMFNYYSTLTRCFPFIFGMLLAFIHKYFKFKNVFKSKFIYYIYLIILTILFIFTSVNSKYYLVSTLLSVLITMRLIDYSVIKTGNNKIIKVLSNITYIVYLVQYPIIYVFQYIELSYYLNILLIILLVLVISSLLYFTLYYKGKGVLFKYILLSIVLLISSYGVYKYIISKDYTKEMKMLQKDLEVNESKLEEKRKEYMEKLKQEEDEWNSVLSSMDVDTMEVENVIHNLRVIGVGDSVMLGALDNLYETFPNGYFDAQISRTAWVVNGILKEIKNINSLGDAIILNLGANGDCSLTCKKQIMETIDGKDVFWVNVTNDSSVHVNSKIKDLSKEYENLHIVDWYNISKGHSEYFVADGIHLTKVGREVYTKSIYDAIYNEYLHKREVEKENAIKNHEEELKNKISFYGNDILVNTYKYLKDNYSNSLFITDKDFSFESIKKELENSINNNTLTYKIVFMFDSLSELNNNQYQELVNICNGHEIYIIDIFDKINIDNENVHIIKFNSSNYLMVDNVHLTKEGASKLGEIIKENIGNI